jgi:hypothetical protein
VALVRRWLEIFFGVAAGSLAALTIATVPFDDLGPWSAGVLGPLVIIGAVVCVLSWPPSFAGDEEAAAEPRERWRLLYLLPVVVLAVAAPMLLGQPPAGLTPLLALGLFALLAYSALLGGVVIFLVVLLPIGYLLKSAGLVARGRRVSPYVPLGALLTLSVAATATAGAIALDGLPDGALGMIFVVLGVFGVRPDSVVVASAGWLLAARVSLLLLVGTVIGLFIAGRRNAP